MNTYKIERKSLDDIRRNYIYKIVEDLERYYFEPGIVNLMQSFVYLILNSDFHHEIIKIRKGLFINEDEFIKRNGYEKWKSNEKLRALHRKVEIFVDKNNLCFQKQKLIIIELVSNYVLLKNSSPVSLNEDFWEYNRFIGGFDIPDPRCGEYNTKNFDKIWWELYIHPMNNITQFKGALEHYFAWMMKFHFKEFYKSELFELHNKDILKKIDIRIKKPAELKISYSKNKATLKFVSYYSTKTKEIERLFERNQGEIVKFQKNAKSLQKDIRGSISVFPIKLRHYFYYLDGKSAPEIERALYNKQATDIYSKKAEYIRTHVKEVKRKTSLAFNRKLSL